jgi:hypothetical protein
VVKKDVYKTKKGQEIWPSKVFGEAGIPAEIWAPLAAALIFSLFLS